MAMVAPHHPAPINRTRLPATPSATRPSFSASASSPNTPRRQPRSAGTSGLVLRRQPVDVVGRGDQLGRHVVLLALGRQQHLQQRHQRRRGAGAVAAARRLRQRVVGQARRLGDGGQQPGAAAAFGEAAGDAAAAGQGLGVAGAVAAISSRLSSRTRRWRGMLTRCASRSRQAAAARSTPSMRRLLVRGRSRSHIVSGSAR